MTTAYRFVPLGINQRCVLKSLRDRGPYWAGGPWVRVSHGYTVDVLVSLERRQLVEMEQATWYITDKGLEAL